MTIVYERPPDHKYPGNELEPEYTINLTSAYPWVVGKGTVCHACGHPIERHNEHGECYASDGLYEDGEFKPCWCDLFVPPARYNPLALEYIGVAFLLWRKERGDKRHLGRCLKALTDSFQEVAES